MNISKVEEFVGYNIAKDILKQSVGDGLEFEMMYQAILDSMNNESDISEDTADKLKGSYNNLTTSVSSTRIDDIDLTFINGNNEIYGRNPIDYMVNKLERSSSLNSNNSNGSINGYDSIINNLQNSIFFNKEFFLL